MEMAYRVKNGTANENGKWVRKRVMANGKAPGTTKGNGNGSSIVIVGDDANN